jgi:hypothetical protein
MNFFKKLLRLREEQRPEKEIETKVSSLTQEESCALALAVIKNVSFFEAEAVPNSEHRDLPTAYAFLFCPPVSYSSKFQDLIISNIGVPNWLPKNRFPNMAIIGSMGEAGYLLCHQSDNLEIINVDSSFREIVQRYRSLYDMILIETACAEPSILTRN